MIRKKMKDQVEKETKTKENCTFRPEINHSVAPKNVKSKIMFEFAWVVKWYSN